MFRVRPGCPTLLVGADFAEISEFAFASLDPEQIMADDRESNSDEGQASTPPLPHGGNGAQGDRPELDQLPPPAFPPGERGAKYSRTIRTPLGEPDPAQRGGAGTGKPGVPEEAFISPDEPIVREGSRIAPDAFISPDEPIPEEGPGEGVVTGIGNDAHLEEVDPNSRHHDAALADLVAQVGRLADDLRDHGEEGLSATAEMSRFEATLRAYCVGYLVAEREAEEE